MTDRSWSLRGEPVPLPAEVLSRYRGMLEAFRRRQPLHYRCITVALPLHYRCITVALPLHYRYITATLPLHARGLSAQAASLLRVLAPVC